VVGNGNQVQALSLRRSYDRFWRGGYVCYVVGPGDAMNVQIASEKSSATIKPKCFCDVHAFPHRQAISTT
jgi:hypothetical protein